MITRTSDSHQIPSQNKTKSKFNFFLNSHSTHFLKLLDNMYKYEMDRQTDGQMDGQMDGWSETNIPPNNFVVRGDMRNNVSPCQHGQLADSHLSVPVTWTGCFWSNVGCLAKSYCKTSNIRRTLVGNKIVDHSDVVGASPVGAAPTTFSFWT